MKELKIMLLLLILFYISSPVFAQDIFDAVKKNDTALVKSLLEKEASLANAKDESGRTPLHWAVRSNPINIELMKLLIDKGADVNAADSGKSIPLHRVAASRVEVRGCKEAAELLIASGSNINAENTLGSSPLSSAMGRGQRVIVKLLAENGAMTPVSGKKGIEMLHNAAAGGFQELLDLLISRGTDIQSKNSIGRTLLHSAIVGGLSETARWLISRGFSVRQKDLYTMTPLHYAALQGQLKVVELLLAKDADLNVSTKSGKRPLHLAQENKHQEVVQYLVSKEADQSPPRFPDLRGEYMGEKKPGLVPEVFAPGLVSTYLNDHSVAVFAPDGKEIYWSPMLQNPMRQVMFHMKIENDRWSAPQVVSFSGKGFECIPAITRDGKRIYFTSTRPVKGEDKGRNIWYSDRIPTGWAEPQLVEAPVSSGEEGMQVSVADDGTLLFDSGRGEDKLHIYYAELVRGKHLTPVRLPAPIYDESQSSDPFIAPDKSYLLFTRQVPEGKGGLDIYVSFRQKDGSWEKPMNLGDRINTSDHEAFPVVSPGGNYLFFVRSMNNGDIYWVDAKIIKALQKKTDKGNGYGTETHF